MLVSSLTAIKKKGLSYDRATYKYYCQCHSVCCGTISQSALIRLMTFTAQVKGSKKAPNRLQYL